MSGINLTRSDEPVTPKPGVYYNVPWQKYASWNAFSKSMVSSALTSGKHLQHYINSGKKTKSLNFGSVVDCLVLEPELFDFTFAIQPSTYKSEKTTGRGDNKKTIEVEKPWNLNSHTCKEIKAEIESSGLAIVSESEKMRADDIKDQIMSNSEAREIIGCGERQVSIVWTEENTGVLCKGRFDLVDDKAISDLKTSMDASPDGFSRQAGNFLYHVQAAAYTRAWKQIKGLELQFNWVVAETSEKTELPEVAVYSMDYDDEDMEVGYKMFQRACKKIVDYSKYGFGGYSKFVEPISMPRYIIERELRHHE
jgi:exodeoxyribonuclease VIII